MRKLFLLFAAILTLSASAYAQSNAENPQFRQFKGRATAPSNPTAGSFRMYVDTDGDVHIVESDGTDTEIGAGGGAGTPGGADTQVQYNDGGAFGGDTGFVFNETTDAVTIAGPLTSGLITAAAGSSNHLLTGTDSSGNTPTVTIRNASAVSNNAFPTLRFEDSASNTNVGHIAGNSVAAGTIGFGIQQGLTLGVNTSTHMIGFRVNATAIGRFSTNGLQLTNNGSFDTLAGQFHVQGTYTSVGIYHSTTDANTALASSVHNVFLVNDNATANNWTRISFGDNGTTAGASLASKITSHASDYGELNFWTRGATGFLERWKITEGGDLLPGLASTYDVGSASLLVGQVYISAQDAFTGSILLGGDLARSIYSAGAGQIGIRGDSDIQLNTGTAVEIIDGTNPTLRLNENNAEFFRLYITGETGSEEKAALADNTATAFVRLAAATADTAVSGRVAYSVEAIDPTGHVVQVETGEALFAIVNTNGTVTASIQSDPTGQQQLTSGTLGVTFDTNVSTTNVDLRVISDTSLDASATTHRIRYRVHVLSGAVDVTVTPQ